MPGCILRAMGGDFNVDGFLSTSSLKPYLVWRKDAPLRPNSPPPPNSGLAILVSDASGDDLEGQVRDAEWFLETNKQQLELLSQADGVELIVLDFGIVRNEELVVQSAYFPVGLVSLTGALGIGIVLTQYPSCPSGEAA